MIATASVLEEGSRFWWMRAEKITDHQTKYDFISQILLKKWGTFDEIFCCDISGYMSTSDRPVSTGSFG